MVYEATAFRLVRVPSGPPGAAGVPCGATDCSRPLNPETLHRESLIGLSVRRARGSSPVDAVT